MDTFIRYESFDSTSHILGSFFILKIYIQYWELNSLYYLTIPIIDVMELTKII